MEAEIETSGTCVHRQSLLSKLLPTNRLSNLGFIKILLLILPIVGRSV
jgi:hypothetical protein